MGWNGREGLLMFKEVATSESQMHAKPILGFTDALPALQSRGLVKGS